MAFSNQRVVSDGSLQTIILAIAFFDKSEIHVYVDDIEKFVDVDFIWATSNSVQFPANLPNGTTVILRRVTDISEMRHVFTAGAQFTNQTLDEDYTQILHIAQESVEGSYTTELFNDLAMHQYRVRNMGDAVLPGDAVPLSQVQTIITSSPDLQRAVRAPSYEGALPELPSAASRANKVMGFDAVGNPIATLPASGSGTELAIDLANYIDSFKGSGMLGHGRSPLATAVSRSVAQRLSSTQVDIWEFEYLVTYRPVPTDFGTWDWTPALEEARLVLGFLGGGDLTFGTGGIFQAWEARLDRFIVYNGRGAQSCELKQFAGANRDFIKSESFDDLSLSSLTTADSRVPSWMGLKDIRINGNRYRASTNPTGNTSGTPVKMYGPSQLMLGTVLIYEGADMGLYTEDAASASGVGWQSQEEGKFDNVAVMDCGGFAGWHCRGPHNNTANSIICGRNDGWNFYSEESALWGGSFDWIGVLHTYAGGRGSIPAADTGAYIGGIARIGTLVSDGDNPNLKANNLQIATWRAFNLGGETQAVIDGSDCQIDNFNGSMWQFSVGKTGLTINGNNASIKGTLNSNNPDNNGLLVKGTGHTVDMTVRNFFSAGRTGVRLQTTDSEIKAKIRNCAEAFNYESGSDNQIQLSIQTTGAQVPVAGQGPSVSDRMDIRSRGSVVGGLKAKLQTDPLAMDISTYTIVTIAHGLLYAPLPKEVQLTWIASSPDSSVWGEAILRVVTCTATDVVLSYKLDTAAPAGTKARIGVYIDLT